MKISVSTCVLVLTAAAMSGTALVGAAQAGFWSPLADPPKTNAAAPVLLAAGATHYRDGSFTGPVTDAYYGQMQVKANILGGRLVSVDVLKFPADRRTSRSINDRALPRLQSEVIKAQSTRVDIVSGATLSSKAYLRSLNTALGQAGN